MTFTLPIPRVRFVCATLSLCLLALLASRPWKAAAQDTGVVLTPGMLFGPLYVNDKQHIELCASFLSEGSITATVHFRNLSTGEVTPGEVLTMPSGGGACSVYRGAGHVVGMARGDGSASDWVSPSNALISSMSVIEDPSPSAAGADPNDAKGSIRAAVLGVPKIWVKGL